MTPPAEDARSAPCRIAVTGHALVQPECRERWRLLAGEHDTEVHLLVPSRWRSTWFGRLTMWTPEPIDDGRFHVTPIPVSHRSSWGRYAFLSVDARLRAIRPEVIFVYGEEFSLLLHQMITYRDVWLPQAKLGFFTWNNLAILGGRKRWLKKRLWRRVCRRTNFAIAGNREGAGLLREAGYPNRIEIQTELGVDEKLFYPDESARKTMRAALGFEEQQFVIGFVGRLTASKGVRDLFAALEEIRGNWALLAVGDGDLREELRSRACRHGWNVVFSGQVHPARVPAYMRAMDCLVLPSRTTPDWKEQFGLVLAQAMLCGVPVIGSDSGAIPETIGEAGLLFPEGDTDALAAHIRRLMQRPEMRAELAAVGRRWGSARYSATALAAETAALLDEIAGTTG